MEIRELDQDWEEAVGSPDVDAIKLDGITIRSGNKLLKLMVAEETLLPQEEMKAEMAEKFKVHLETLQSNFESYKSSMRIALQKTKDDYKTKEDVLKEQMRQVNRIPNIDDHHASKGLSVTNNGNGNGLVWFYNCVYQPVFINDKRLDPTWAKRLITPITIRIKTNSNNNNKTTEISVRKIIGHGKFEHYHLNGSVDCWGDFRSSGIVVDTPEDAIALARRALIVLQTINEFSLGRNNPKGLSKFTTLKKHLIDVDVDVAETRTAVNVRSDRSGFDVNTNDGLEEDVWST